MDENAIMQLENIKFIVDVIKIYFIILCTYYTASKLANKTKCIKIRNLIIMSASMLLVSFMSKIIKCSFGFFYCVLFIECFLSIIFSNNKKITYISSLLIMIVALSINYILIFISIAISFMPIIILNIKNDYISLSIIVFIYVMIVKYFFKIRKFKKGFSFLQTKLKNEYFDILILNISVVILFAVIILSNYNIIIARSIGPGLIIFSIIMFITIQKSLQLYYKQKLLVQELEETKEELEEKKQEVEQLEKENLNFIKTSHSIAHKQKALEYKLNELMLKNEIADEIDIKDRIKSISKEVYKETAIVELTKTNIPEIDDMLKYMQSECAKNKIDFQLQVSGNINHMSNKYVSKEDLEILLADHIKNAIIAINYSENTNKSILVRIGKIDGAYGLYLYDSGIEFEIGTLLNLGKIPSTTHNDSGGTGMGFMNTFDTLKKYKASLVINEYGKLSKDSYTKLIMIKFDDKNEYKICSYRGEEINNKNDNNNLIVEQISI